MSVRTAGTALVVALAAFLLLPAASATSVGNAPWARSTPSSVALVNPGATWDGKPLSDASSQANAFSIRTDQQIYVNFSYTAPLHAPNISVARIQALYFGVVISTDQVSTSTILHEGVGQGTGLMKWSLGDFTDLLAGVYLLTASLVDSNGTTVWSTNFYIDATPAYHIASGLIIFLLLLGLVEIYYIATVGRPVKRPPKSSGSPPTPWTGATTPAEGATPPPGSAPPPSGDAPSGGTP